MPTATLGRIFLLHLLVVIAVSTDAQNVRRLRFSELLRYAQAPEAELQAYHDSLQAQHARMLMAGGPEFKPAGWTPGPLTSLPDQITTLVEVDNGNSPLMATSTLHFPLDSASRRYIRYEVNSKAVGIGYPRFLIDSIRASGYRISMPDTLATSPRCTQKVETRFENEVFNGIISSCRYEYRRPGAKRNAEKETEYWYVVEIRRK